MEISKSYQIAITSQLCSNAVESLMYYFVGLFRCLHSKLKSYKIEILIDIDISL